VTCLKYLGNSLISGHWEVDYSLVKATHTLQQQYDV